MAEAFSAAEEPTLTLIIDNREPLALNVIASLLTAVAEDYTQASQRELTIRSARQGSFVAQLVELGTEALTIAGAVVTMKEFIGLIGGLIGKAKDQPKALAITRSSGVKTVRALMETARSSHADVEILYESTGERVSVRMTRTDAEQIYFVSQQPRAVQSRRPASRPSKEAEGERKVDQAIEEFAKAAANVSGDLETSEEENPAFALVKVLVMDVRLQPGGQERLERISRSLLSQGQVAAARLLNRFLTD